MLSPNYHKPSSNLYFVNTELDCMGGGGGGVWNMHYSNSSISEVVLGLLGACLNLGWCMVLNLMLPG
jgi:hypothetical protein